MELVFEINDDNFKVSNKNLEFKFLDLLVESIQTDIRNGLIPAKFEMLEQGLLNATWIRWVKKPSAINISKLIERILSNIKWQVRGKTYRIYIDTNVKMPYTVNTSLEQIARFLDKGNNVSKYSTMFSRVFNYYQENIKSYWKAYVEFGDIFEVEKEIK